MADPNIGDRIDSYCGRCKMMLAHTVETIEGGKIKKCHCNTCGAQHAYRPKPPKKIPGMPSVPEPSDYDKLMKAQDTSKARKYATSDRYQPTELINHASFGYGIVLTCKESNKIDVLFSDGAKTMVHGALAPGRPTIDSGGGPPESCAALWRQSSFSSVTG